MIPLPALTVGDPNKGTDYFADADRSVPKETQIFDF